MFLHDWHHGRPFNKAANPGFPFLATDSLVVQNKEEAQDKRSIYNFLKPMDNIRPELDACIVENDKNETFQQDIAWRSQHLKKELNFWNLVSSDLPTQLSEGIALGDDGPIDVIGGRDLRLDHSALCIHPQFKNALLVRGPFRSFHRSDGT